MCPHGEQYEAVCRDQFQSLHQQLNQVVSKDELAAVHDRLGDVDDKLEKLDEAIRGNGKPGLVLRLDRLERSETTRRKIIWMTIGSLVPLIVAAIWRLIVEK